jgi:hypothetical protein
MVLWISITILAGILNTASTVHARTRDLVATPPLMGSPLQGIDSQMSAGEMQRFESRMLDSPLQLIGSPFGYHRFATLPNFHTVWASRRAISALPAMVQTPYWTVLLLPYYVVPYVYITAASPLLSVVREQDFHSGERQVSAGRPKFFSARCGQFTEIVAPLEGSLEEEENKPC